MVLTSSIRHSPTSAPQAARRLVGKVVSCDSIYTVYLVPFQSRSSDDPDVYSMFCSDIKCADCAIATLFVHRDRGLPSPGMKLARRRRSRAHPPDSTVSTRPTDQALRAAGGLFPRRCAVVLDSEPTLSSAGRLCDSCEAPGRGEAADSEQKKDEYSQAVTACPMLSAPCPSLPRDTAGTWQSCHGQCVKTWIVWAI